MLQSNDAFFRAAWWRQYSAAEKAAPETQRRLRQHSSSSKALLGVTPRGNRDIKGPAIDSPGPPVPASPPQIKGKTNDQAKKKLEDSVQVAHTPPGPHANPEVPGLVLWNRTSRSSAVGDVGAEPVQTLVKPLAGGGAAALDVPVALAQGVQAKLVGDLCCVHGVGQVLLIGEHEEDGVAQLVLIQHAVQLVAGLANAIAIIAIHHEDQALRVLEVMPPKRTDLQHKRHNISLNCVQLEL